MKQHKLKIVDNKINFIYMKLQGKMKFEGLRKLEIVRLLESHNFDKIHNEDYLPLPLSSSMLSSEEEDENESEESKELEFCDDVRGYDYLMKMLCWAFSREEVIFCIS